MKWILQAWVCVMLGVGCAWAQVTILNPHHVFVPQDRVNLLFRMSRDVISREFQLKDQRRMDFPLTLVLGEQNERLSLDEDHQVYEVLLNNWDESKFVTSVMRLAVWRVVPRERRNQLVLEILQRARTVGTVSVGSLRGK